MMKGGNFLGISRGRWLWIGFVLLAVLSKWLSQPALPPDVPGFTFKDFQRMEENQQEQMRRA